MPCVKCTEKFVLSNSPSKLYFISEFDELIRKTNIFFKKLGLDANVNDGILILDVMDTHNFFKENIDALNEYFNVLEKNDIKVFLEDEKNRFTYKSMLTIKSLQRYINLFLDKEFFDIINNESLTSYFQPIIKISDDSIYGYETLFRGVKANVELMYPNELFEKSKRNDLNFKLDRLCRETSLKTAATKKVHQKVFINFIPTSIYDPEFCLASTVKWAKQLDFDPKNIVFEVVETQNVKDKEHLKTILNYYRSKGFLIALDDVGEGYSSLNMIIDIKPDIIKVDRNIIENIDKDTMKQSIYRALRTICVENSIKLLAEGVETPYELEKIKEIGVDYAQGYYFAKPSAEIIRII